MQTATVQIRIERTLDEAIRGILGDMAEHLNGEVAIMPSTLEHRDLVGESIEVALPPTVHAGIMTPITGSDARKAMIMPARTTRWTEVPVTEPGARLASAQLPKSIMSASHRIIATDVVEVARHGPFVLDVPARYVHPRQRVRLVSDRERSELLAEVASVVPISMAVVSLVLPEGAFVAVTADPIAAELVALALSERCLGSVRSFSGPWEDPVVQRATELRIGVLVPALIRLIPDGTRAREPWADALVEHVRRRIGIPGTSSMQL